MSALDEDVVWEPVETAGFTEDEIYAFLAGMEIPLTAAFWREKEHPRDKDGQFTRTALAGNDVYSSVPALDTSTAQGRATRSALNLFGTSYFSKINGELRAKKGNVKKLEGKPGLEPGQIGSTEILQETVRSLDKGMTDSKLTQDITVSRAIKDPAAVFGKAWKPDGDNTGLSWKDDGFVSTTADTEFAGRYAGPGDGVLMNLFVPAGIGGLNLSQQEDDSKALKQIVLERGLKFKIVRDNGAENGMRQLDVEVRSE